MELASTVQGGLARVRPQAHDLALVDLFLPDGTAIDLLTTQARGRSLDTAVEAMRQGAIDYAVKPLIGDDLLAKVEWGLRYASHRATPPIPPEAFGHAAGHAGVRADRCDQRKTVVPPHGRSARRHDTDAFERDQAADGEPFR